jgi:predicted Fe-S protein YdhL (DUF1289 family)
MSALADDGREATTATTTADDIARRRLDERAALALRAAVAQRAMRDVPSPCVSVCRMDAASGLCTGCLRTLDEIAGWSRMEDACKRRVWRAIELRTRLSSPMPATASAPS